MSQFPIGAEVSQSGPEPVRMHHSASLWKGGKAGLEEPVLFKRGPKWDEGARDIFTNGREDTSQEKPEKQAGVFS